MAKYSSLLSLVFAMFMLAISSILSASEILLVKGPEENYYIVKKTPVVITCQAKNAAEIIYTCTGTQIPETSVELEDVTDIDPNLIQAKIDVTRADIQNYAGEEPFWCTCSAVDANGRVAVTSRKGHVSIPYLKKNFVTQPNSTTVTVGDNVEFRCVAPEGQPNPVTFWRKDNKKMEAENNPRMIITVIGSLVITSVTKKDSGMYQCVARNIIARRESEVAQLTVIALEESSEPVLVLSEEGEANHNGASVSKPRTTRQSIKTYFTMEPQENYYVTENQSLLIECGVAAADILTFSCNGKRMDRERQMTNQGLDTAGNRNIQSQLTVLYDDVQAFEAEPGSSKTFQCICVAWFQDSGSPNGWGRLDSSKDLGFVFLAYLDSEFQNEPSDITVSLNRDVTLACEPPNGQPSPFVYWFKDGSRLDLRIRYTMNSKGHLIIPSVQKEDAGTYNCVAQNSAKSIQSRMAKLSVAGDTPVTTAAYSSEDNIPDFPDTIPNTPVFLLDVSPQNTLEKNGTVPIVCAAISADQMTIDCGGQRLTDEEHELQSKTHRETGKHLFQAKTVVSAEKVAQNPDDYFCQCTAWFVNEQLSWGKVFSSKGYIRLRDKDIYIGDQFTIGSYEEYTYINAHGILKCKPPEGNPAPTVYWMKNGIRIDPQADPNLTINEESLIFENARTSDEGQYNCVAENEAGTRLSHPINLAVMENPEPPTTTEMTKPDVQSTTIETTTVSGPDATDVIMPTVPLFIVVPEAENYIIKDQPVNISCSVIAAKSLLIICNGQVMTDTTSTELHYTHSGSQQFVQGISFVVTNEHVDTSTGSKPYTCVCRANYQVDEADSDQQKHVDSSPAVIEVAYLRNRFLQEPSDTQVTNLGTAELLCRAPNGIPKPEVRWLKDGFRISTNERIRVADNGSLIIDNFIKTDEGNYTCVAVNLVRSRTSHAANVTLVDVSNQSVSTPDTNTSPDTVQPEPKTTSAAEDGLASYPSKPYISKDLDEVYHLVENKPVTIICEARGVEFVTFTCGMQKVEDQEIKERMEAKFHQGGQLEMVKIIEASINVSEREVENYEPGNDYWCQCYAHFRTAGSEEYQELISTKGVVKLSGKNSSLTDGEDTKNSNCAQMIRDCSSHLPHNFPNLEMCLDNPEYISCMDDYFIKCTGVIEDASMNAVKMSYLDSQKMCSLRPKCPELESCKRMPSNSHASGLTVYNFCSDGNTLLHCVDRALAACNITLSQSEEEVKTNLFKVVKWFTNFCEKMIIGINSLATCDQMMNCDIHISLLATDNTTSWCSLITSLVGCTNDAVNTCKLDELRKDLEQLYSQSNAITCSEDQNEKKIGDSSSFVTHEPEGKTEPKGDNKSEPSVDTKIKSIEGEEDSSNGDYNGSNNERIDGDAAAAKEHVDNGFAMVYTTSVLLTTILPLLALAVLS